MLLFIIIHTTILLYFAKQHYTTTAQPFAILHNSLLYYAILDTKSTNSIYFLQLDNNNDHIGLWILIDLDIHNKQCKDG